MTGSLAVPFRFTAQMHDWFFCRIALTVFEMYVLSLVDAVLIVGRDCILYRCSWKMTNFLKNCKEKFAGSKIVCTFAIPSEQARENQRSLTILREITR